MNREDLLRELGLTPIWRLRSRPSAAVPRAPQAPAAQAPMPGAVVASVALAAAAPPPDAAELPAPTPPAAAIGADRIAGIAAMDWEELASASAECRACGLCQHRKQAVLGVGDRHPDWLFIGEGPGEQEDERGEPFVGPAGQLLDAMLAAIGLQRGQGVYIANAVKCRPPANRTPTADEIAACRPFLMRQIALLRPRVIVLLGRAAVLSLLEKDTALASLRGRVHASGKTPVIATYHPAYLLRSPTEKAKSWEDLCLARRALSTASRLDSASPESDGR